MSRWIILLMFGLVSACSSFTPDTTVLPAGTDVPSLEDLTKGVHFILRQVLEQGEGGYFVLQFNTLPDEATRRELEQAGIRLGDFVPENAYQAYLPADALPTLEKLIESGNLRYAGPIPLEAKLQPELATKIQADPQASYAVVVHLFVRPPEDVKRQLESWMDVTGTSFGPINIIEGSVKGANISNILAMPLVKWVEERTPSDLGNN
jgi:hypothetical protein